MKSITGFFMAWGNFCAIPCPCKIWDEKARPYMLAFIPAIGLMIGGLWCGLFWLLKGLKMPLPICSAVMTAWPFLISGFIHLDGFMDCNDAILSRRPLEQRQRILKDSHAGAFAVITAILLFMMMFSCMWTVLEEGHTWICWCLLAAPVLARCFPAADVLTKKPLSTSQYDRGFSPKTNRKFRYILTAVWILTILILAGAAAFCREEDFFKAALIMAGSQLAASLISGSYGRKQLGGMSGDIAGFAIVWGELAAVVSLAVIQPWI